MRDPSPLPGSNLPMPIPKCPVNGYHHMKYRGGLHPRRWFYCFQCNEYWREMGESLGRTMIAKAFESEHETP
jgi:hypothetical protein